MTELGKFKAKARDAEESAAANEKLAQDAAAEIEKRRMSADAAEESMFKELERRKAVADESKREVKKLKQDVRALHETIATLETAEREAVERFAAAAANETKIAKALRDANEAAEARESTGADLARRSSPGNLSTGRATLVALVGMSTLVSQGTTVGASTRRGWAMS